MKLSDCKRGMSVIYCQGHYGKVTGQKVRKWLAEIVGVHGTKIRIQGNFGRGEEIREVPPGHLILTSDLER